MISAGAGGVSGINASANGPEFSITLLQTGQYIAGQEIHPGDVIARGLILENSGMCYMAPYHVSVKAPTSVGRGLVTTEVDAACNLRLVRAEEHYEQTASSNPEKEVRQHVWMYGHGGSWDQLTNLYNTIRFTYGTSATLTYAAYECIGSSPGWWSWVVDACIRETLVWGPASKVSQIVRGEYHCDPWWAEPCVFANGYGYYHNLRNGIDAYSSGNAYCQYTFGGTIVSGVTRNTQNCSQI